MIYRFLIAGSLGFMVPDLDATPIGSILDVKEQLVAASVSRVCLIHSHFFG